VVGTFQQIVAFFICTALGFIALAAGVLFVVRRRAPREGSFKTPGYPVTPALFVLLIAGVVVLVAVNRPLQAIAGLAIVLVGVPAHALFASHGVITERVPKGIDR
jgi:APA family basic amino acid/polyamine antiporter